MRCVKRLRRAVKKFYRKKMQIFVETAMKEMWGYWSFHWDSLCLWDVESPHGPHCVRRAAELHQPTTTLLRNLKKIGPGSSRVKKYTTLEMCLIVRQCRAAGVEQDQKDLLNLPLCKVMNCYINFSHCEGQNLTEFQSGRLASTDLNWPKPWSWVELLWRDVFTMKVKIQLNSSPVKWL